MGDSGKKPLTFKASEAYTDLPVAVPCGHCIGCRTDKANQWAARCYHEAKMHEHNSFLTLTYNPENMPEGKTLVKEHLQKFIKRLREAVWPDLVRFYGVGEYGEKFNRPHYHILLFGYSFPDRVLFKPGRDSISHVYTSEMLSQPWRYGYSTVGEVSIESAKYVAAYTAKKQFGPEAEKHYNGKLPEFAVMSRRPGIGHAWFNKYTNDVYPKDFFTIKGVKYRPPRYYDNLLEKKSPKTLERVKVKRLLKSNETDEGGVSRYKRCEAKEENAKHAERRKIERELR